MTMMTITKVTMMAEMTDKTMMTRREDDGVSAASSHPCGHQEQQTVVSLCIILHCIVHNAHILVHYCTCMLCTVSNQMSPRATACGFSQHRRPCALYCAPQTSMCVQCTVCNVHIVQQSNVTNCSQYKPICASHCHHLQQTLLPLMSMCNCSTGSSTSNSA